MTLLLRYMTRHLLPGDLKSKMPPLGHAGSQNTESSHVISEETLVSLKPECRRRGASQRSPIFQEDSFNHSTRSPALLIYKWKYCLGCKSIYIQMTNYYGFVIDIMSYTLQLGIYWQSRQY